MPDKKIPVALVTGKGGPHLGAYFSALASSPDCDEVVVCDPGGDCFDEAKAKLGEKLSAVFTDLDRMLKAADPDLALVSVEAAEAPPVLDRLLDADCHLFVEKPACTRAEDIEPLVAKAEEKGLQMMFALANRITPAVRKMRELIDDGTLGDLYGAEIHLVADQTRLSKESYQNSWFADRERAGGGHLIWLGIHWLDLTMLATGHAITDVSGFAGIVGGQPLKIEDSAALAMRFDNGAFGTMHSGYYLDKGYHSHLRLWGSNGWIEYAEHLGGRTEVPLRWYRNDEPEKGIVDYDGPMEPKGYTPYVHQCIRAAAGTGKAPITGAEALRVLRTIFAFYEAAETGKTVAVPS
ncbi:MAG: Gfo/Idh/MocA family oxidoreductase [Verrucomicrobiales bacterium]|nr:Gfo/Idh/MocA family oxidoreductase [Verrucomicrobiales bacterium]